MISHYFKIALRYLIKNKLYSFINVAGLCLSLSCAMLMILYTKDEWSFDKFHEDTQSTFLIAINVQNPDGSSADKMGITSLLHGPRLKDNLPEITSFIRLKSIYSNIKLKEEVFNQEILVADNNFFSFFTFPLLKGNSETVLQNIHSIVVSETMAIRHFGDVNVLGKTIMLESEGIFTPYTVTGVAKRCPQNSSVQFEAIVPLQEKNEDTGWVNVSFSTFIKLAKGSDLTSVSSKIQTLFEAESKEEMELVKSYGFTQSFHHELQALTDVHLSQQYKAEAGLTKSSNPLYSYILSGIAVFVVLIACVNFINLTIARSAKRAREIGIRKVVGSGRKQLITQFLGESLVLCFVSFAGAIFLAYLLLPVFNTLVNKELSLSFLQDINLLLLYLALPLITGLLAGFYPAIVLSSYHPVQTLYSRFKLSSGNYFQKTLIVFQFALATCLIIATGVIYLQFDYLTSKNLGYTPENVVSVPKQDLSYREAKLFSEALTQNPTIVSVSPQHHGMENGKVNVDSILHFTYEAVNENFIDLLGIEIQQGRNFSPQSPSDSANALLVNEAFVIKAGWKEPIGQVVTMMDGTQGRVIGIVKDYHFESVKKKIEPQLFSLALNSYYPAYQHLLIRIQPGSEAISMPFIAKTFKELFPMHPYTYSFYEDNNLLNYQAEATWKKVILFSSLLTIFIAGIGLFGLSILTAESRFKEIGIRKVLGANVSSIVVTLYKDDLILISGALIVALPASYYASLLWLSQYPYRTEVNIEIFASAAFLVLLIAGITISYQSIKTALMNPVDSLRNE